MDWRMDSCAECIIMAKSLKYESAIAYLRRFPHYINVSDDYIIVSTNKAQTISSFAWIFFAILPVIGIWQLPAFRFGWGLVLYLVTQILIIYQIYRFIRGHNALYINIRERYVESKNVVFLFKYFFRDKRIGFDDIKGIAINAKEERNTEDRDVLTTWSQLIILSKKDKTKIFIDFEKGTQYVRYLKYVLDELANIKQR